MIKEILNKPYESHTSSGKFSISGIGGCWRRKYFELKGEYKEDFSEELKRIFEIGNIFHRGLINELLYKGNNGVHLVSAEVLIPEHPRISGRIDAIVSDGKDLFVVDVKSSSKWTLDKVKEGEVPQNYIDQVNLYLHFLRLRHGILLFVGKDKGVLEEVPVEYDEKRALAQIKEIEEFFEIYVNKNVEPAKCTQEIYPFGCKCCGVEGSWQ